MYHKQLHFILEHWLFFKSHVLKCIIVFTMILLQMNEKFHNCGQNNFFLFISFPTININKNYFINWHASQFTKNMSKMDGGQTIKWPWPVLTMNLYKWWHWLPWWHNVHIHDYADTGSVWVWFVRIYWFFEMLMTVIND